MCWHGDFEPRTLGLGEPGRPKCCSRPRDVSSVPCVKAVACALLSPLLSLRGLNGSFSVLKPSARSCRRRIADQSGGRKGGGSGPVLGGEVLVLHLPSMVECVEGRVSDEEW